MPFTREFFDPFLVYAAIMALCAALLSARTVREPYRVDMPSDQNEALQLTIVTMVCTLVAGILGNNGGGALVAAAITTLSVSGLRIALPRLTLVGAMTMTVLPFSFVAGSCWSWALLREAEAPGWLLALSLAGMLIAFISLFLAFAEALARQALLTHISWRRPYQPLPAAASHPRVSIHLPCYAEPPEVVIATLDRLAALDYSDFEVMVCDNNTPDEALWRPVEAHCARLNRAAGQERFRFFHVAPLAGAKAGALNWLLDRMDPAAALVAVIDADYLAAPDFLSWLVGYFEDPAIGYVQTPHDYRGWEGNPYLSACYWEYMPNNKIELSGLNEYGAAFTIGTMCVIRAEALERAGRWAEWCLTEDSEVSVRLRALGYHGIYLRETFGRGLIPETFADYRKQRFRWIAGPVQQLRRHWRLYLPGRLAAPSALDNWSKLLEFQRGIAPPLQALGAAMGLVGAGLFVALAAVGAVPVIDLPAAAWFASAIGMTSTLVSRWHRYRLSGCNDIKHMLGGELARLSLTYVQMLGGIAGLSARPLAWRRTPKFRAESSGSRALAGTMPETAIGLGHLLVLAAPLAFGDQLGGDMLAALLIGGTLSAARFLAAPVMALLGERGLAARGEAPPLPLLAGSLMPPPWSTPGPGS